MITCLFCGKGLEEGPLLRVNEKGKPGVFAHEQCTDMEVPNEVAEIVAIIDKENINPTIH